MENEHEKPVFKVPKLLIGPRPGTKKPVASSKCVDPKQPAADGDDDTAATESARDGDEEQIDRANKIHKKTSQVPIPYQEPSWGGKPGEEYSLEVRCVVRE